MARTPRPSLQGFVKSNPYDEGYYSACQDRIIRIIRQNLTELMDMVAFQLQEPQETKDIVKGKLTECLVLMNKVPLSHAIKAEKLKALRELQEDTDQYLEKQNTMNKTKK